MVTHSCNLTTKEAEIGGMPGFKASVGFRVRPFPKQIKNSYVEALTHFTVECDFIWRQGFSGIQGSTSNLISQHRTEEP